MGESRTITQRDGSTFTNSLSEALTQRDGKATQEASLFRLTVSCSKSFAGKSRSEILEGIGVKPEKSLVLVAGRRYS